MNRMTKAYMLAVAIGGLMGLLYGLANLPQGDLIWVLVVLAVLSGLAQAAQVPLFASSSVSLAFAVSFISLLLFGPAGGIMANLGSAAVHAFYPQRRQWYKVAFNASVFTISASMAGAAYSLAGGIWPVRELMSSAIPALVAGLIYFLVNTTLISGIVSLTTGTAVRRVFNDNYGWLILQYLTVAAISLMAAFGYESMGFPGLIALSVPLLMPWASTRMYVAQSKKVFARNDELIQLNAMLGETNASLQRRVEEMDTLHKIGLALNRTIELSEMLAYVSNSVRELTHAHGVAIFVYEKERNHFQLGGQVGFSDRYLQSPELSLNGPAKRAISAKRRILLDGKVAYTDFLSASAAAEGIVAAACLPLTAGDEIAGALDVTFLEPHTFSDNELTVLETFAEQVASGIHNARLYQQLNNTYLSTIAALVATVEAKDPYTRGHSERVRDYAVSIGLQMELQPQELNTLELSALFHDIGKIGIPEEVLGKNGSLTPEEWELVRRHPALAETILRHIPSLAETIPIIRAHHERPDGQGYPDRLSGDLPRLSAIIAVADAYDAMTSERPYRKAMSKEYAITQLKAGLGSQFDTSSVEAFLRVLEPQTLVRPQFLVPAMKLQSPGIGLEA